MHGRLEILNLSSRVHIRYLTCSLRSLIRYRCEHSKINSISPRTHVLFSVYYMALVCDQCNAPSDWLYTDLSGHYAGIVPMGRLLIMQIRKSLALKIQVH